MLFWAKGLFFYWLKCTKSIIIQFKTAYIGLYMPQDLHSNFSWEEKVTKRTLALYNRQAALSVVELGRLQVCGDIGYPLSLSTQIKKTTVELFNDKPLYIPPSNTSLFVDGLVLTLFVLRLKRLTLALNRAGRGKCCILAYFSCY